MKVLQSKATFLTQVNLGNMYYTGLGVTKNLERARELFGLAAEIDDNAKELLKVVDEELKESGNSNS